MLKLLITSLLFIAAIPAQSQIGKITGSVNNHKEMSGAIVSLLKGKDSSLLKTSFIEEDGSFNFEKLAEGNYFIKITHTSFETYYSSLITITNQQSSFVLQPFSLKPAVKELQEVNVTGKKSFVERKIDRVVINPDLLISNAGATSLEVLEKAPGVLVDIDGNISLKGKQGVFVFIDDKPTYLAAADLASYLRSIPSSSIESIEIMTNPPAKYDAEGNAGVINIKLKRNRAKGFNGSITLSYGQATYMRTNNSFNFNYRINKVNFFSNFSWNQNNTYQDLTINRYYFNPNGSKNSTFSQNSYIKKELKSTNLRIGADYYVTSKSTLGIALSGFINPSFVPTTNKANLLDANDDVVNLIRASNPSDKVWKNGSINLNYALKMKKPGEELSVNLDYIQYKSTHTQLLKNSTYTADTILVNETTLSSSLPSSIGVRTGKIDYSTPLSKGIKMDAGGKISFVKTDNTADFFDVVNTVPTPNYEFSNRFKYQENINAAYLNFSKEGKAFSIQAGLRLENTNIKGNQLGNPLIKDSSFTRNYTSLFPTFYLSYKLDTSDKHQLGFSFGRRVDRPNYQDMNPFTYPLDRYTYYGGNPFLEPTFSYNFEFSHTYKNFLTTSLEYSLVKNLIQETNEQKGTIYYSRPGNFGKQQVYGITVNGNFKIAKWWTLQLYTEGKVMSYESMIYGQVLDESRFYWFIQPVNQFIITKSLSAELGGSYQSRILVAQFLTIPVWQARIGVSQKIWKGKGTLRLNVSDMFYSNQPGGDIRNIANSKANWLSYLDSRVASLSFTYRFNKGKSLNARESGASDTEKNRIKTN